MLKKTWNAAFSALKKIGQGASAEVYKVIVDLPQGVIAVKVCKNTKLAFDEYGRINFI